MKNHGNDTWHVRFDDGAWMQMAERKIKYGR